MEATARRRDRAAGCDAPLVGSPRGDGGYCPSPRSGGWMRRSAGWWVAPRRWRLLSVAAIGRLDATLRWLVGRPAATELLSEDQRDAVRRQHARGVHARRERVRLRGH